MITEEEIKTLDKLMYALTKEAARTSFVDFLENWGISEEEYESVRKHLAVTYGVRTYV